MKATATTLNTSLLQTRRVLIADDVGVDRMLLADFLARQGCRVYVATDGQDAYRKAQSVMPELILMDIYMPVCDGLAACRLLKANVVTRDIPLIFLTAADSVRERIAGLSAGAVDYIGKPFDFEEVRLRMCIHLRAAEGNMEKPQENDSMSLDSSTIDAVLFRAAQRILLDNLHETPELARLAQATGTSSKRLNAAFKHCIGVTVFDYLREERMKRARQLLSTTDLPIRTITQELGFASPANFSTAFRERFGLPPSEFRQQQGAEV